jgi:aminoglycoside phosphotransferase family enzyme
MNYVLLLGAGFSKNWDGWLGVEAFEYLLGYSAIRDNARLRDILWKYQFSGGFEDALAEVQTAFLNDPAQHRTDFEAMQGGVSQMFEDMNRAFVGPKFRFHFSKAAAGQDVIAFLSKFDAIFTLNQDLLLERHYLSATLAEPYRYWSCHDLPGMRPGRTPQIRCG